MTEDDFAESSSSDNVESSSSGESYIDWTWVDWNDGERSTENVSVITQKNGGLCGTVHLVEAGTYMYAGIGFDIVDGAKTGEDITSWNGITTVYSSEVNATLGLEANGRSENGYDDLRAELPPVSKPTKITLAWSDFAEAGLRSRSSLLKMIEMIDIQFNDGGKTEGDFCIYAIGINQPEF